MSLQYFLREDLEIVKKRIKILQKEIDEAGKRIFEACDQGAETYHDNAPFDEAVRHQQILSRQLADLFAMIKNAYPIDRPTSAERVSIGTKVVASFTGDDEPTELIIGSFINLSTKDNVVSYSSPLGQNLLGLKPGDKCSFIIGKRHIEVRVLKIILPSSEERSQ